MASYWQLKNSKWRAQICVHKIRASASFPTRDQAEEWAQEMEDFIRRERKPAPDPKKQISVQEKLALAKKTLKESRSTLFMPRGKALTDFGLPEAEDLLNESFEVSGDFSGLYFLFSEGSVVYVGQSMNVFCRVSRHMANKVFDRFAVLRCKPEELLELESIYIGILKPVYNKTTGAIEIRGRDEPMSFDKNMLDKVREWGLSSKKGKNGGRKYA